ncbi:MAG: PDZ domain-containing protein [Clostridiales bacterium]|nr:PDZ domain-containing protein [Clostridiales bacterium]
MIRNTKKLGILSLLLTFALIFTIALTSSAANGSIKQDEIDALVNTQTDKSQIQSPFLSVANEVRESVVGVNNYQNISAGNPFGGGRFSVDPFQSREQLAGTGSGVVISKYGHILTNNHVVKDASRITVTYGTKEAEATLILHDEGLDVAVLLVSGIGLEPVILGNSDDIQVGEWAIVIGNPLGQEFDRSVTVGVISAYDRSIKGNANDRYGRRTTVTNQMIQVDAAISSGNSGGGMFNMLGQLQGIPTLKFDSSRSIFSYSSASIDNIGMCVPVNVAKPLIREALEQYNEATVEAASVRDQEEDTKASSDPDRPRMGVTVGTLSPSINTAVPGGLPNGAYVSEVEKGSPADQAGLKPGDIIVEVDKTIVPSHEELIKKLAGYSVGDKVEVTYFRAPGLNEVILGSADISTIKDGDYETTTVELRSLSKSL